MRRYVMILDLHITDEQYKADALRFYEPEDFEVEIKAFNRANKGFKVTVVKTIPTYDNKVE